MKTDTVIQILKIMEMEEEDPNGAEALKAAIEAVTKTRWIPISKRLPEVDDEACSKSVLISLREVIWDIDESQEVHITKIAYYDKYAISSDGIYMDTEGWVLKDGSTFSMDEVLAWMPLPKSYKEESEDKR